MLMRKLVPNPQLSSCLLASTEATSGIKCKMLLNQMLVSTAWSIQISMELCFQKYFSRYTLCSLVIFVLVLARKPTQS